MSKLFHAASTAAMRFSLLLWEVLQASISTWCQMLKSSGFRLQEFGGQIPFDQYPPDPSLFSRYLSTDLAVWQEAPS